MYEEKDRMDAKEGKRSLRVACAFVYWCIDRFSPSLAVHYSSAKKQALKEVMSKITQPSSFLLSEFERQDSDKQKLMFERKNVNKKATFRIWI